jgi:DNA-binding transcriptional ArsR family regulator
VTQGMTDGEAAGVRPPALPHPLPDALVELVARRFRVIGEPMRIRLLDRLRSGEATVQALTDSLGASQQNVSKHLAVLHDAGIVARRKEGTQVHYRVVDSGVFELCESVCGSMLRQVAELNAILVGPER